MAIATLDRLSYWYPRAGTPALDGVALRVEAGLTLLAGPSGGGKSSLLRVFNGLVPHFHGGRIAGTAVVAGLDVFETSTRRLAREVGFVFQDPEAQAVSGTVDREVAFGLENLDVGRTEMVIRVGEALERLGLSSLRGRRLATLSGGERQRVALASALVLRPRLLALDEPTAQLDPDGARALVDACLDLAGSGHAVIVAEHRLERLLPSAARLALITTGRLCGPAAPREMAARLPSPPQVVTLGVRLGWRPLPLTLDEARPLIPRLIPRFGPPAKRPSQDGEQAWALSAVTAGRSSPVLEGVGLVGLAGQATVLMGPNGGGKTTLLRTLAGLLPPLAGNVERGPGRVAYLPQNPQDLLHRPTVRDEVALTLRRSGDPEPPARILDRLGLGALADCYPRDLSSGERQRTAQAAILAGSPALALLDEPTRGMDAAAREALAGLLLDLQGRGGSVVVATHDSELAARVADRVVMVERGTAVDAGSPEEALSGDAAYATQLGRLYPGGPVTMAQFEASL